jgi:long-chain fatty acid transport protein
VRRLALFAFAVALPVVAHAAGLGRPNVVGARAIGLGGAFTAIADDPTAVWHNPAGTAMYGDNVAYIGAELVFLNRTYTPDAQSPLGQAGVTKTLTENTAPTFIPDIGVTTRFGFGKSAPTRFAFSLGAYDAYGGSISYRSSDLKNAGLQSTQILDFELTPTLAYQVTDALSVGAGLRIGINSFSVADNESVFSASLSGNGVGIGGVLGVMVRPHKMVQLGATYRSPLSASVSGNGPVTIGPTGPNNPATQQDFGVHVDWPQSASLGVAVFPHPRFMTTVQADWTAWSSIQNLTLDVLGMQQVKQMRYMDTYAVHVGFQGIVNRYLLLRLGWALDSNAIPDRTMRRENQDALKSTLAVGVGVHVWKLFFDGAFEAFLPLGDRVVPNDPSGENESGKYVATIYTASLSAQIRF